MVALDEVRERAKKGRSARSERVPPAVPVETPDETPIETAPSVQHETASTQASGHVILPIEAWQRLLEQLGNLHEAGQQHAEARERAAKAETTVEFLRERIRELERELISGPESTHRPRWWRRAGWSDYDR